MFDLLPRGAGKFLAFGVITSAVMFVAGVAVIAYAIKWVIN